MLVLLLLVLAVMLFDTRCRLKRMEERVLLLEAARMHGALADEDAPFAGVADAGQVLAERLEVAGEAAVAERLRPEPWRNDAVSVRVARVEEDGEQDSRADRMDAASEESAESQVEAAAFVRETAQEAVPENAPENLPEREPEPALEPERTAPVAPRGFGFEDMFGRRLPIWAGGITLAVAGVLLVKYSIDAGLISPAVRLLLGLLFGGALIGGAEVALRQEHRLRDPRVRQSLAGAGVATLYAVTLAAANLYDLIGPGTAFAGLAIVTVLAMGLSLRFGAPSALLGLMGGLAAPAMAGSAEPDVPLLTCYLALTVGALCALSRTQRWMWLGVGALIGGAGWGSVLILSGALDRTSSVSVGLLIIAVGLGFPLLSFSGSRATAMRAVSAVVASAQMAALVATGGFALLHWGLFGLLSVAFIWLSGREPGLRRLVPVGLGVALLLAGAWPDPDALPYLVVLLAITIIYGGAALWRMWQPGGGLSEAGQIAGVTLGGLAVATLHLHGGFLVDQMRFALAALGAALLPGVAMRMGWSDPTRHGDARFALLATNAAMLLVLAGLYVWSGWPVPILFALAAAGLLGLAGKAEDRRVEWSGWAFLFLSLSLLASGERGGAELARLTGEGEGAVTLPALLRWGVVAAATALYAWRARFAEGRIVAQVVAVLAAYGAVAQLVPPVGLASVAMLGLLGLAEWARRLSPLRLLPALGAALALVLLWAGGPLLIWSGHGLMSLLGQPMLASDLPAAGDVLRRLALPALFVALAAWRGAAVIRRPARIVGGGVSALLGAVALNMLYKQLFALGHHEDFVRAGLAERTVWEMLLVGAGWAVWRFGGRIGGLLPMGRAQIVGGLLVATGMAHHLIYTLLLHNPLWAAQAVGAVPLFNLVVPAYGVAFGALVLGRRMAPDGAQRVGRLIDGLAMILIALFAFTALRQLFEGSMLNLPHLSAGEDIGRSVLAIALAIGFLLWGIRRGARDWRIASLLLMLAAVAKVFLLDASGLTGLARIGSFLALGFSLIGVGWLYSRNLRADAD